MPSFERLDDSAAAGDSSSRSRASEGEPEATVQHLIDILGANPPAPRLIFGPSGTTPAFDELFVRNLLEDESSRTGAYLALNACAHRTGAADLLAALEEAPAAASGEAKRSPLERSVNVREYFAAVETLRRLASNVPTSSLEESAPASGRSTPPSEESTPASEESTPASDANASSEGGSPPEAPVAPSADGGGQTDKAKLTVSLPSSDLALLAHLADGMASNRTTALARAIRLASYLHDAARQGSKIVVEEADGKRREIVIV